MPSPWPGGRALTPPPAAALRAPPSRTRPLSPARPRPAPSDPPNTLGPPTPIHPGPPPPRSPPAPGPRPASALPPAPPESVPRPFSRPSTNNSLPPPPTPASRARLWGGDRRGARDPGARAPPAAPGSAAGSPVEGRAGAGGGLGRRPLPRLRPVAARSLRRAAPRRSAEGRHGGRAPRRRAPSFLPTGRAPAVAPARTWGGGGVPGERVSGRGRGREPPSAPKVWVRGRPGTGAARTAPRGGVGEEGHPSDLPSHRRSLGSRNWGGGRAGEPERGRSEGGRCLRGAVAGRHQRVMLQTPEGGRQGGPGFCPEHLRERVAFLMEKTGLDINWGMEQSYDKQNLRRMGVRKTKDYRFAGPCLKMVTQLRALMTLRVWGESHGNLT